MHNVQDKLLLYILGLTFTLVSFSQQITVRGGFVQDSVRIGENVDYWLTAEYPEAIDLVLPDTLYSFQPWEFANKKYFPSTLKDGVVYDSAVYSLQSYEIDLVQYLSLPAFIIEGEEDTVIIEGTRDSIFFSTMLPVKADTLQLKTNLAYQDVDSMINYPLIWIILGVLLVLVIIGFLIFGKRIQKALKLRKLKKEYIKFSEQLSQNIKTLKSSPNQSLAELSLGQWKAFLETMEQRPFTKLTTKEIMALEYTNELNGTLKNIDRCVYGGKLDDNLYKDFQAIEDFTQHRYTVITDQIKQGNEEHLVSTDPKLEERTQKEIRKADLDTINYEKEVFEGGKFVIYYYTISIIVLTFRRTSKVYFVKGSESRIKKGLPFTLLTFFFGWWGFPFGLIYTPQSLYINLKGGKDVTNEVLNRANN